MYNQLTVAITLWCGSSLWEQPAPCANILELCHSEVGSTKEEKEKNRRGEANADIRGKISVKAIWCSGDQSHCKPTVLLSPLTAFSQLQIALIPAQTAHTHKPDRSEAHSNCRTPPHYLVREKLHTCFKEKKNHTKIAPTKSLPTNRQLASK